MLEFVQIKQTTTHAIPYILAHGLIHHFRPVGHRLLINLINILRVVEQNPIHRQRLLGDLNNFDKNLENLRRKLAEREQVYTRETSTLTVNGILLYDPQDIDQIYQ